MEEEKAISQAKLSRQLMNVNVCLLTNVILKGQVYYQLQWKRQSFKGKSISIPGHKCDVGNII